MKGYCIAIGANLGAGFLNLGLLIDRLISHTFTSWTYLTIFCIFLSFSVVIFVAKNKIRYVNLDKEDK